MTGAEGFLSVLSAASGAAMVWVWDRLSRRTAIRSAARMWILQFQRELDRRPVKEPGDSTEVAANVASVRAVGGKLAEAIADGIEGIDAVRGFILWMSPLPDISVFVQEHAAELGTAAPFVFELVRLNQNLQRETDRVLDISMQLCVPHSNQPIVGKYLRDSMQRAANFAESARSVVVSAEATTRDWPTSKV